jgi:hypothetical protein
MVAGATSLPARLATRIPTAEALRYECPVRPLTCSPPAE